MEDQETCLKERLESNGFLKNKDFLVHPKLSEKMDVQELRSKTEQLKSDVLEQLETQVSDLFDDFVSGLERNGNENGTAFSSPSKSKNGELPDKVFVPRRSVLTELLEVKHIQTIYNIFVAILIVFSLNTIVNDVIDKGRLVLDFDIIMWAFGKFPFVINMWVIMLLTTTLVVYPLFYYWSTNRRQGPKLGLWDYFWLTVYLVYQVVFFWYPLQYIYDYKLPPVSTLILVTEQTRLFMKSHAFVRSNITRALRKTKDDETPESPCPDFSKYLYFLFAPTLVYRDSYPRTPVIRWKYVVTNLTQVVACLLYTYYIFARFCVPAFRNFSEDSITPKQLLLSSFSCMLPGTLVLVIGFFAVLHSWLNAFAEMLRFADRLFYKDWWNSTSYANYYRTWNVVVHDWLYTYVYKDMYRVQQKLGLQNKTLAMCSVFLLSAVVHEYILSMSFGFFYPVLLVMFGGAGFGFIFLTNKRNSRSWNVFMWVTLFMGSGMLMCLYSMEWYARINCQVYTDSFVDYLIPRSWTCYMKKPATSIHVPTFEKTEL